MRPYSMDLRERVAAAIDGGEGCQRQVARRFRVSAVSRSSLDWSRGVGTPAPWPPNPTAAGRGRPSASPNEYDWRCGSPSTPMPP